MFHTPTSESKQQSDGTQTHSPRADFSARVPMAPSYVGSNLARLHSSYGNQAVLRMLSHSTPTIQTKLTVNQPGDQYEQEADRVADQVMRMADPLSVQRKCSSCEEEEKLQRKCAECEEEEKKGELHRKETNAGPQFAPPLVHQVLNSPGHSLDPATRAFMEPRFGRDFSAVRVHTDANAANSARAVNALAYTSGQHVVFGSNQYSPGTHAGQRLLAHELAHVVQSKPHLARQQTNPPPPNQTPNPPTNQPPSATPNPPTNQPANPPPTCTVPADAAKQIADQGIPAQVIAAMRFAIGKGTIRASQAIPLTDAVINQADAAIKAQFGSLLPSRSFSKGGSITKQTPDQIANARVPNADDARRIIRQVALRTSGDALNALCITTEDDPVLESAVAVPVLASVGIQTVRDYEKSETAGVTSFPTQAGALPNVTLPTESPNIGHIVVHEAMHFYVHDVYRHTAEAGQWRREMMEGGAEFMARLVIMNQLPSDPNFLINYGTYANEVNFIYKNYTSFGGTFPLAYLQGRMDVIGITPVQPKKEIDQSSDPREQEADRMADQVMRMADAPGVQRKCNSCEQEDKLQRKCAECEEEEKKTELHRKETNAGPQFAPPSVQQVLNSPGRPLDRATRAFMEPRFGFDFSGVRIHDGLQAAKSASAIAALAYTVGQDIVFGASQYSPGSNSGQRLLAHELAHVVQQQRAGGFQISTQSAIIQRAPNPDEPQPQPTTCPPASKPGAREVPAGLDTLEDNKEDLAKILWNEAGGDKSIAIAVGSIVLNRVLTTKFHRVRDWKQFGRKADPPQYLIDIAGAILRGQYEDTTGGSWFYVSPQGMPDEAHSSCCAGQSGDCTMPEFAKDKADCKEGLREVDKTGQKRFFPSFAQESKAGTQPSCTEPMKILVYKN